MAGCSDLSADGQALLLRDNELLLITRGSLKLARNALREQNTIDYYHNSGAAEREISRALDGEKEWPTS